MRDRVPSREPRDTAPPRAAASAPEAQRKATARSATPRAVAVVAEIRMPLHGVLPRFGQGAAEALADGRLFIGNRRAVRDDEIVERGDEIVMFRAREVTGRMVVLGECEGIVAVAKPASMASVPDRLGRGGSLVEVLVGHFGARARQWEPTSRLDVGVSGVVLFATHARARGWLALARTEHRYLRHYVAIASRAPSPRQGMWDAAIGRDRDPCLRRVNGRDPKPATTRYAVAAEAAPTGAALLAVEPQTGRTHQIRVHASHAGAALVGDAAYGGTARLVGATGAVVPLHRIALHAAWVEVPATPLATSVWRVEAPVEDELVDLWRRLAGDQTAWARALERC